MAYYQGFVDSVQVLDGPGIIKKRMRIKILKYSSDRQRGGRKDIRRSLPSVLTY